MQSLNADLKEYTEQLQKGQIQRAYRGIMTFMSGLKNYMASKYPENTVSALYFGYMDMTYFALVPSCLKDKKLKVPIVYLHEAGRVEVWLSGSNRNIQADIISQLRGKDLGSYTLSKVLPGVDSIIESIIVEQPDLDNPKASIALIESKTLKFIDDMAAILKL